MPRAVGIVLAVFMAAVALTSAAQSPGPLIFAASGPELAGALSRIDAWLSDGRLDIGSLQEDTMIAGTLHERLEQRYQGLRVFGGDLVRQMDGRGVVTVFGRLHDDIGVEPIPLIDQAAAAAVATSAQGGGAVADPEPELGVLPLAGGGYALAYRFLVRGPDDIHRYFINARTGAIERHYTLLQSQSVVGRGTGVFGDPKKMSVNQNAGSFRAEDLLRPAPGLTFDFHGNIPRLNTFMAGGPLFVSDFATDPDNVWTDGPTVDAHAYEGYTYDYYFKRFGRRGINDANLQPLVIVHPINRSDAGLVSSTTRGTFINNALYLGNGFLMFGDGDGSLFDFLSGGLDVVAHETTHGVTEFTSALEYFEESGALNEAYSDIVGASVEFFFQPQGTGRMRSDWLIGEDVAVGSPGMIRSLRAPTEAGYPDHYSQRFTGVADNGGVHLNASMVDHVFYLAVVGGTHRFSGIAVQGVGFANLERMERIFYRAFAFFLVPSSQFRDARTATLQAASELYGSSSNERAQLAQAWTAVGVN
jgi:thermolysin